MQSQEELEKRVSELERIIQLMQAGGTFPYDIGVAIKERLNVSEDVVIYSSQDSSPSVQQVDEGGIDIYNVASPMVGFVYLVTPNGQTYKIPRY